MEATSLNRHGDGTGLDAVPDEDQGAIWSWPDRSGVSSKLGLFLLVAALYGLGSQFAYWLIEASGLQGVFFIPSGITVAFLLRLPRRHWAIVLLAAGLTEYLMDLRGGFTSAEALGFAAANTAEPLLGAAIVTATCGAVDLVRRRHVLWFTLGAVLAGPAVGAAIGAGADRLFGGDDFLTTFSQWWLGDALGVILVGSAILAWGSSLDRRSIFSLWGALLVVGSSALTVVVITSSDLPIVYSALIGISLAAVLFGVRAVAVTALAIALTIAVTLAIEQGDLIIGLTQASALVVVKLQVGVFTLAGLLIAAESHERDLATRRATQAAIEAEAIERERQREHDLAVEIQKGLLPGRLIQHPGVDIAARYEAASDALEVGGDWFDTIELPDGQIGLVVGDIVGHGIEAMTSMGRLRTAVSALAPHYEDPAALLSAVDSFVGGPDGTEYATVLYLIFHPEHKSLRYASAGHPPALLVSSEGARSWLDEGQSGPLYGRAVQRRGSAEASWDDGSVLVLYSDGLVERRGESLTAGLVRLEGTVTGLTHETPAQICETVFERLVGTRREDDVVVMVMKTTTARTEEFHESFPARPEELHLIRDAMRSWMENCDIPNNVLEDVIIAVNEATSNGVRHAYIDGRDGDIEVEASHADHTIEVRVSDAGTWKPEDPESGSAGWGIDIIEALTDELGFERSDHGTVVSFQIRYRDSDL